MIDDPSVFLRRLLDAAIASALPEVSLPAHVAAIERPKGRTVVVGAGKAAAAMALSFELEWERPLEGAVVTRHGSALATERIAVMEARHPVPDEGSERAARRMLELVEGLGADDLVVALISGGASSLMALPADGLTLDDKLAVNRALLRSGATIGEMNCVRRHLSRIKGGRLARAAAPARLITLAISDVPSDDPAAIGSGPTVGDPTTYADARAIADKYRLELPARVVAALAREGDETPKPGDPAFARSRYTLIATPAMALEAAAKIARATGLRVIELGDALEGEAREVAREHARMARTAAPGTLFLSGGELTVTIRGGGSGGPNTEYALALAIALDGAANVSALAADTDGIDGAGENAGALVHPDTLSRWRTAGIDAAGCLAENDSHRAFAAIGDLVVTGPMQTNVNDFRAVLVL